MSCLLCLAQATAVLADSKAPACAAASVPNVWLNTAAPSSEAIARSLAAGLAGSGIAVCREDTAPGSRVARVDLANTAAADSWQIVVTDDATHKLLERSIDLGPMPEDSRAVALALYIEELLQASWAELALERREYLSSRSVAAPPELRAEVARVLPVAPESEAAALFRLSLAGVFAASSGGPLQFGGQLGVALRALSWLEPGVRIGYGASPEVDGSAGSIDTRFAWAGVSLDLLVRSRETLSVRLPQGIDVMSVTFVGHPRRDYEGHRETRGAVRVTHGLGARVLLGATLALSAAASFVWTLLPAEAADALRTVTGIRGFGGKLELAIDATF